MSQHGIQQSNDGELHKTQYVELDASWSGRHSFSPPIWIHRGWNSATPFTGTKSLSKAARSSAKEVNMKTWEWIALFVTMSAGSYASTLLLGDGPALIGQLPGVLLTGGLFIYFRYKITGKVL